MRLCDLSKAVEMGDHVVGTTPGTRKPIYAGRGPAHEAYHGFTTGEHLAAANVHTAKAKDLHIASSRVGGSLTMKRQAQQHSQFATMHRQAATQAPAGQQKLAASRRGLSAAPGVYASILRKADGNSPPEGVRSACKRGLSLVSEYGGDGLTEGAKSRARSMAAGESVSTETLKRIKAFHARHTYPKEANPPSPGYVAFLLWGGAAGKSWANGSADTED